MTIVVFLGPSLPRQAAEQVLTADYQPPVRQGDVHRVVRAKKPSAIAIIDGYFQEVPSVWHKEILWALDQGTSVYGAASMGALRAAELERFGMLGVGRIFEGFRDGVYPPYGDDLFEDDDEVAVIHGPAELGFPALSDAMVDLRSTFAQAAEEKVIDTTLRDRLVAAYKQRFYRDRSFAALPDVLAGLDVAANTAEGLQGWLAAGRVDQKRLDAMALLSLLATESPSRAAASKADPFVFEATTLWAQFVEASGEGAGFQISQVESLVLDELRLDPELYDTVRPMAALRYACHSGRQATEPDDVERRSAVNLLRRRNGLWSRDALDAWAKSNDLNRAGFNRLVDTEARVEQLAGAAGASLAPFLLDVLRRDSRYDGLAKRAREKARAAAAEDETEGLPQPAGSLTPEFLVDWYFEERLGRGVPSDPRQVSDELGFATFEAFVDVLAREYHYLRRNPNGQ